MLDCAGKMCWLLETEQTDRCCSETESVTAQICSGRNRTEPHTQIRASRDRRGGRQVARRHGDNWRNDGHLMPLNFLSQVTTAAQDAAFFMCTLPTLRLGRYK